MKLYSWNVNGYRAAWRGGFLDWLRERAPDVVCLQETKVHPEQLDEERLHPLGYRSYWHSARKRGYSGVATLCKREPARVTEGLGVPAFDDEGRVLTTEIADLVLVNAYFPNSQRDHARLPHKLAFCDAILQRLDAYRQEGRHVILCGDYNIAHRPIDLANPKQNERNAGYLPEERAWMDELEAHGWIDAFRHACDEPGHYTWWSYRPGVRERNIGWRIDYFTVNPQLVARVARAFIEPQVMGSDHCPIGLEIRG
jgi:exodeoxyribonuclease-3